MLGNYHEIVRQNYGQPGLYKPAINVVTENTHEFAYRGTNNFFFSAETLINPSQIDKYGFYFRCRLELRVLPPSVTNAVYQIYFTDNGNQRIFRVRFSVLNGVIYLLVSTPKTANEINIILPAELGFYDFNVVGEYDLTPGGFAKYVLSVFDNRIEVTNLSTLRIDCIGNILIQDTGVCDAVGGSDLFSVDFYTYGVFNDILPAEPSPLPPPLPIVFPSKTLLMPLANFKFNTQLQNLKR